MTGLFFIAAAPGSAHPDLKAFYETSGPGEGTNVVYVAAFVLTCLLSAAGIYFGLRGRTPEAGTDRPSAEELSGMSLLERLVACRLRGKWESALRRGDRPELTSILQAAGFAEEEAGRRVDASLAKQNPPEPPR